MRLVLQLILLQKPEELLKMLLILRKKENKYDVENKSVKQHRNSSKCYVTCSKSKKVIDVK